MRFKYEGNQQLWIAKNGHPVTILGRTEFFNDREPRYYVKSETHIPGKNVSEDWINESQLTHIKPEEPQAQEAPKEASRRQSALRKRPGGIRKQGLRGGN